jgi:tetratricopeptide (TPR) repeat protein
MKKLMLSLLCAASIVLAAGGADLEARKREAQRLLSAGKTEVALEKITALNKETPDDLDIYGMLVDAYRTLGNLPAAERAAQWMLDLRVADVRGLSRAALLREDYKDIEGAIELWNECYHRTAASEPAVRAYYLKNIARLFETTGKSSEAKQLNTEAAKLMLAAQTQPAQPKAQAEHR